MQSVNVDAAVTRCREELLRRAEEHREHAADDRDEAAVDRATAEGLEEGPLSGS